MKIYSIAIENFGGIRSAKLILPEHAVLIGDNNTGKSSVLEAIDLVLGPDRLSRRPPVDEHDFYQGKYLAVADEGAERAVPAEAPKITVEVTITSLSAEPQARFGDYVEWLKTSTGEFYDAPDPAGVDAVDISAALRVTFIGAYPHRGRVTRPRVWRGQSSLRMIGPRLCRSRTPNCGSWRATLPRSWMRYLDLAPSDQR